MVASNIDIFSLDTLINLHVNQDLKEINDKDMSVKEKKALLRGMLKYHAARERTWTLREIVDCLKFGYKVIVTVKLGEFKGGVCDVSDPNEFEELVYKYSFNLKPRYLSYKEEIFMLIENFIIEWPPGTIKANQYTSKQSARELHSYLFSKQRMTKADHDMLISGII